MPFWQYVWSLSTQLTTRPALTNDQEIDRTWVFSRREGKTPTESLRWHWTSQEHHYTRFWSVEKIGTTRCRTFFAFALFANQNPQTEHTLIWSNRDVFVGQKWKSSRLRTADVRTLQQGSHGVRSERRSARANVSHPRVSTQSAVPCGSMGCHYV